MQALAGLAILGLVAASIAVALRLLALWTRTRALPELLLGAMLLLTVGIGYPGLIAASRIEGPWLAPVYAVANVAVGAGFALLFAFTQRVFRPREGWAKALALCGIALLACNAALRLHDVLLAGHVRMGHEAVRDSLLQTAAVTLAYLWTACESLAYHAKMRRRVRLGLADPVVANRFLIWGAMSLVTSVGILLNSAALGLGMDVMNEPGVLFLSSCTGLAQAVLLLLAFLPPRSYLDRIRSRAAPLAAPGEA